jgi:hypothetical protein
MEKVIFGIQSLKDAKNGKPVLPDMQGVDPTTVPRCVPMFGILEGGTVSGATSIMILLKDPETGHMHYGEMTMGHLETLVEVVKAANIRFKNEADGR